MCFKGAKFLSELFFFLKRKKKQTTVKRQKHQHQLVLMCIKRRVKRQKFCARASERAKESEEFHTEWKLLACLAAAVAALHSSPATFKSLKIEDETGFKPNGATPSEVTSTSYRNPSFTPHLPPQPLLGRPVGVGSGSEFRDVVRQLRFGRSLAGWFFFCLFSFGGASLCLFFGFFLRRRKKKTITKEK